MKSAEEVWLRFVVAQLRADHSSIPTGSVQITARADAILLTAHHLTSAWMKPSVRPVRRSNSQMPETPDFDQIARKIGESLTVADLDEARATFAESLRLVWNARGAADITKL